MHIAQRMQIAFQQQNRKQAFFMMRSLMLYLGFCILMLGFFWIVRENSNKTAYALLFFYAVFPVMTLWLSYLISKQETTRYQKLFFLFFFTMMYYILETAAGMVLEGVPLAAFSPSGRSRLFWGFLISASGFLIGQAEQKQQNRPERSFR